jgi:hypothetical protein
VSALVVEVSGISDEELDGTVAAIRNLQDVGSADALYNGLKMGLQADVSFLVFENAQQKEYLGARTNVLGVDPFFRPRSGYYTNFRWLNPSAPRAVLGIPLLPAAGEFRSPQANEMLLPTTVTDYVGVQSGAQATVELLYTHSNPPIVRNNFISAQRERRKIGTGGRYFAGLLLALLVFGTGGLQVLATLTRWRGYGVLQAVGFSPGQILMVYGAQLLLVVTSAIAFSGLALLFRSHLAHTRGVFVTATALAAVATIAGSVPALLWPMLTRPAIMLKELQ